LKKDIQDFEEVQDLSLEEYGILVPNKDMEKLSKAMELIYSDESLIEKYSSKSLERCRSFDIEKII
jgi:glycosyltransferase involved in cell wall biosynthesis